MPHGRWQEILVKYFRTVFTTLNHVRTRWEHFERLRDHGTSLCTRSSSRSAHRQSLSCICDSVSFSSGTELNQSSWNLAIFLWRFSPYCSFFEASVVSLHIFLGHIPPENEEENDFVEPCDERPIPFFEMCPMKWRVCGRWFYNRQNNCPNGSVWSVLLKGVCIPEGYYSKTTTTSVTTTTPTSTTTQGEGKVMKRFSRITKIIFESNINASFTGLR